VKLPFSHTPDYTVQRKISSPIYNLGMGYKQVVLGRAGIELELTSVPIPLEDSYPLVDIIRYSQGVTVYDWKPYNDHPGFALRVLDYSTGYFQGPDFANITVNLGPAKIDHHYGLTNEDLTRPRVTYPIVTDPVPPPVSVPAVGLANYNFSEASRVKFTWVGVNVTYRNGVVLNQPLTEFNGPTVALGTYTATWRAKAADIAFGIDKRLDDLGGAIAVWPWFNPQGWITGFCKEWSLTHLGNDFYDIQANITETLVKG
jgi:hypothetical protein